MAHRQYGTSNDGLTILPFTSRRATTSAAPSQAMISATARGGVGNNTQVVHIQSR
jgi:hypothetical protein